MPDDLRSRLEECAKSSGRSLHAEILARLEDSLEPKQSADLRVELDTNGMPISWDEIHEYLSKLKRAGNLNPSSMAVSIITPEVLSSADRQQEARQLADKLSKLDPK
jgi:hypothetical protein